MSEADGAPPQMSQASNAPLPVTPVYQTSRWFLLIPALLGVLAALSYAPAEIYPGTIFALAVLMLVWRGAATSRLAALQGFVFGIGLFGAGVSWVYVSLAEFGGMPAPIAIAATGLFCAILALYPAAVGYLQHRLGGGFALRALLTVPALWSISEWLRDVVTGFPWLALGYSQIAASPLLGYAPVVGVFGVSLAVLLAAGALAILVSALAEAIAARSGADAKIHAQAAVGRGAACLVTLIALFGAGYALRQIAWTEPAGPSFKAALLQGNIAQNLKFDEETYAQTLAIYRKLALSSDARLIVWPETAIPHLLETVDEEYIEDLRKRAAANRADMLIGIPYGDDANRYYNSVWSFGASPTQSYSKTHLVPFGEFIPKGFDWILVILHIPMGEFTRGAEHPAPLAIAGAQVAANICYEDAFGEEIIRQLPQATVLVNVSNVAWFGHSVAPEQHLQISQMRSVETGRPMLRATNTGVTAAIDARGVVDKQLPQFTEGALIAQVQPMQGATPFVNWGNAPAIAIAVAMLCIGVLIGRRKG